MSDVCLTPCYNEIMEKTLTIRLDKAQDKALMERAKAMGKSRSALVRGLIDRAVNGEPMNQRVGHLEGRLDLPRARTGWRGHLRSRNWR